MSLIVFCERCKNYLEKNLSEVQSTLLNDIIYLFILNEDQAVKVDLTLSHFPQRLENDIRNLEIRNLIVTTECDLNKLKVYPFGIFSSQIGESKWCSICYDREKHIRNFDNYEDF